MGFELRELSPSDGCNALSLGDQAFTPLKSFLRKEAKKLHQEHLARTFVLVRRGEATVLAYITTLCTHVAVQQFGEPMVLDGFRYKDYPAIKLARLAVDSSLKRQGIGSQLVDFVIGLITEHVMPYTGCRFLVVDSKNESVNFYLSKGFLPIGESNDGGSEYRGNIARNFNHQTSHSLVTDAANDHSAPKLIVMEALKIANMVRRPKARQDTSGQWLKNRAAQKGGLNKAILLSCWGAIATQVKYKGFRHSALVLSVPAAYSSQECSSCRHIHPDNRHEQRFVCQRCGHAEHADTNAGKVIAGRGVKAVRDQTVVVKAVKRSAYKKRRPKEYSGRESSGVPVDADVSRGQAQAKTTQWQMKQEVLAAMPDAPTTAPQGV